MRQRIDAALASEDPHPGRRIALGGIAPRAQGAFLAAAEPGDIAALLHAAAERRDDPELRALLRQAAVVAALALLVVACVIYGWVGVFPKVHMMFHSLRIDGGLVFGLLRAARAASIGILVAAITVAVVTAIGQRRGWWIVLGGWARRARGLVLRRLLGASARESEIADAMRGLMPRAPRALDEAGGHGDLAAVLRISGWPVRTPAELDRALAADLRRRDRWRTRIAATVRLALPFVLGVPIGMTASAVFLEVSEIQASSMANAGGERAELAGGTPSLMLLYWATAGCEAQGDAVVDDYRERRLHPPIPVLPRTKPPAKKP
jgi:hypothetical protein